MFIFMRERENGNAWCTNLVVEDDEWLRDVVCRNLQARQHEVYTACDAHNALASLRAMPFDLVLLDINLPDQTGWEIYG